MFLHFKSFVLFVSIILSGMLSVFAQQATPTPTPTPAKVEKKDNKQEKNSAANATAEQVAESAIIIYGGLTGGRPGLNQIRKTSVERGKIFITNADGTIDTANYEKRILRGESLEKEKIRFDQEFPTARFALIYRDNKITGLFNDSVFTPREDASNAFTNQIWRGLEGLLRYKENGSTLNLVGKEKQNGVEFYVLDVTDKLERKTRFYISAKFFKVMWLEYTEGGIKYVRKFSDYRYAQGTLVPYRSVLTANGKQVEETTISTVTYGQKVEEEIFQTS
ncbi:MAG TPA: hypothetical protein PKY82_10900 [Pyrinomonadaceae bacterium]|nr:hypothetical protein [Pyrinomonadaceae bacterium]